MAGPTTRDMFDPQGRGRRQPVPSGGRVCRIARWECAIVRSPRPRGKLPMHRRRSIARLLYSVPQRNMPENRIACAALWARAVYRGGSRNAAGNLPLTGEDGRTTASAGNRQPYPRPYGAVEHKTRQHTHCDEHKIRNVDSFSDRFCSFQCGEQCFGDVRTRIERHVKENRENQTAVCFQKQIGKGSF